MLWYSKLLFGNQWLHLLKLNPDNIKMKTSDMRLSFVSARLGVLFIGLILELIGTYSFLMGLGTGTLVACILFSTNSSQVVYSGKKWQLFLIDTGYHAVGTIIIGIILGIWN